MLRHTGWVVLFALLGTCFQQSESHAQVFGVELRANALPAAGGMAGTGIARPQDVQSSMVLNTATLTQHKGTHFSFSGAWIEPTFNLDNKASLAAGTVTPFRQKSDRPGSLIGNIVATQDFTALGMPVTAGLGLITASGLGVDYRESAASNGTSAEFMVLNTASAIGVELTDRLSLGAGLNISTAQMDGVFAGQSASTPDYGVRGNLGLAYEVFDRTTLGAFWLTKEKHVFENFIKFGPGPVGFQDLSMELPNIFGIGIADESLCCGKLLLALDLQYMMWADTDFWGSLWDDQLAVQTGVQYTTDRGIRLRGGYTFVENASQTGAAGSIGGITPQTSVDYIRALLPNISQNRISAGIGVPNLLPGIDFDLFAGGMFKESQSFGDTTVDLESYWVGFGVTWRFRRGGCGHQCIPDQW